METVPLILQVAVPVPTRCCYDYLGPTEGQIEVKIGSRVKVPFGRRILIGVVIAIKNNSDIPPKQLKPIIALLDLEPLMPSSLLKLCVWAADYYHQGLGMVIANALPVLLRKGRLAQSKVQALWLLNAQGRQQAVEQLPKNARKQKDLLLLLQQHPDGLSPPQLAEFGIGNGICNALLKKGWLDCRQTKPINAYEKQQPESPPALNPEQCEAVKQVVDATATPKTFLLDGITGSGKTEVYLNIIQAVLKQGKQALVLVPEISLTPQTVKRFRRRFTQQIVAVLHSNLADGERLESWLNGRDGSAQIIIGTRSAVFAPLSALGVIIVDEEHDLSFKQQRGFRYSARDVAVMRGKLEQALVVLGSATPSLESMHNAINGRYRQLLLNKRAGGAASPQFHTVDLRDRRLKAGLSQPIFKRITYHLEQQNQVLVFINRRGYSSTLMCHRCGWRAECQQCDARLTLHLEGNHLRCHHCDHRRPYVEACPTCDKSPLMLLGSGTERLEETLTKFFPKVRITRIDRDSTRNRGELERLLNEVNVSASGILIGTQMLAKGHHFPNVTLVVIVNIDAGLFAADFRAPERSAQLLMQVAGRSGRAEKPGEVLIQSYHPQHPILRDLLNKGYRAFAASLLKERQASMLPPFSYLALVRAEGLKREFVYEFLDQAKSICQQMHHQENTPAFLVLGPIPALMERLAGKYRAQLLLQCHQRQVLQQALDPLLSALEKLKAGHKIRWSIDIDPQDSV